MRTCLWDGWPVTNLTLIASPRRPPPPPTRRDAHFARVSSIVSGTWAKALRTLCVLLAVHQPLHAQLPDAFLAHFGATRTRELGIDWSLSLGAILLSEYGSSWDGPPNVWNSTQDFSNYDLLGTTVGYNYLSGGGQWESAAGSGWLVLEASVTLGITSDVVTKWFQDGLHDFGRLPHVYRGRVDAKDELYGLEVVGSYWRSWYFPSFDIDVFSTLGLIWSSYHREASAGVGVGVVSELALAGGSPFGLRAGVGQGLGQSATSVLDRFLNRLPTLTIRAGHRLRIWFTSDVLVPRAGTRQ